MLKLEANNNFELKILGYLRNRHPFMNKIILNKKEKHLFKLIESFVNTLNIPVVPRVAGGWVRDKLLQKECNDIDITLDSMPGLKFAKEFKKHAKIKMSGIGIIKANPEKSKHLETAAMIINDLHIDFLQLRTEDYSIASRIPTVEIGDPEEDAFRRDITINCLFYNILTKQIEDYTRMGLKDIKDKRIRTPLDPAKTFFDDPLRILRVFRFASTLNFTVDEEIYKPLYNQDIQEALRSKVSNQRIGLELQKMFKYKKSQFFIAKIVEYRLHEAITKTKAASDFNKEQVQNYINSINKFEYDDDFLINVYALLHPYSGLKEINVPKPNYINVIISKTHFSWPNRITKRIESIEKNLEYIKNHNEMLTTKNTYGLIKSIRSLGCEWLSSLVIYAGICGSTIYENSIATLGNIQAYIQQINERNYHNIYLIKPIINGKDITKKFTIRPEEIKKYIEESIILQIEMKLTNKEEILECLKISMKTHVFEDY